jgi:hypothetical protein
MIDPRLARLRDEIIRLRRRPGRPIPEDVDDAFRLMLADIRDAITPLSVRTRRLRMTMSLRSSARC